MSPIDNSKKYIYDAELFFPMDEDFFIEEDLKAIAKEIVNTAVTKVMALQKNIRWNIQEINYATKNVLGEIVEFDPFQKQSFTVVYQQNESLQSDDIGSLKIADRKTPYRGGIFSEDKIILEITDLVEDFFTNRYILKKEIAAFKARISLNK